ncbi:MAG: DnaD domain-containing protein [Chloroflexota bacterium]
MSSFNGFPSSKEHLTPIPATFFSELLPAIDHLDELKLTLYAIWKLDRLTGEFRSLRRADFTGDARLMAALAKPGLPGEQAVDEALERAVIRGTLLKVTLKLAQEETFYFLNSPKGRAAVQAIQQGRWRPSREAAAIELDHDRPNVFRLYEQNVGPLTPMLSEELREAEQTYPPEWIHDAIQIAVENNKRNWRYIAAILRRWQEKGRDERKAPDRRDSEKDRRQYADWEDS